mmetsp:Transcript_46304/g.68948  ORF Transcript_46304/g.68948 Transcript_46304/m.68948 type:complete len:348 (-) Transcript_46304:162-1205(-)|eukprot:CAMPEP_0194068982 /NCGR_PEP_ID=MMETSP0009_2-20130614/87392_1 /TAXON_ID=210454 /ORGANISM="Grammatophora oceanica, Strain CCMP 410" /LENGTH=347 /DNA_ID=CAMNT_0038722131 /DNA_START=62 /DNA_END=1105 /DNA_ORIENTATION=+
MEILALILRIVLLPLRWIFGLLFPPNEFDGLSPAVTAKAAQQFTAYLRSLIPTLQEEVFGTQGFSSLKQQAMQQHELLVVYLHSPLHRNSDRVARELLCHDSILAQLASMTCLGVSIHTAQGAQLAQLLGVTSYPALAVLNPSISTLQLLLKIEGPILGRLSTYQLEAYLASVTVTHQSTLAQEEARRMEREQEQALRREQDAEYQATLEADRERQRQAREEEERAQRAVEEAQLAERTAQEEKSLRLQQAKDMLREEPTSGQTHIRFTLPSGRKIQRRFYSDEKIGALRAYLTVYFQEQGMAEMPNIGLSLTYPKKSFNAPDDNLLTMREADLAPQAVLMVQDLDA